MKQVIVSGFIELTMQWVQIKLCLKFLKAVYACKIISKKINKKRLLQVVETTESNLNCTSYTI